MRVTLANGVTIEGTEAEVTKIASQLGISLGNDGTHYMSSTHGLMRIVDMTDNHLMNAIRKMYREWVAKLATDRVTLLQELSEGPTKNVTFVALVKELARRSTKR